MDTLLQPELHHRLRQATKLAHRALDHHPLLAPLVKRDLDVAQYGNALAALHGVYAQAEPRILAFLDQSKGGFDYRVRIKLSALDSDLAAIGRTAVPWQESLPALQTIGAMIGILYTVEGSAQGGQVIARIMRQNTHANLPMRFFTGDGELSRDRWDEFLHFANGCCPLEEYEMAAAAAVSMFEAIKNHLDFSLRYFEEEGMMPLHGRPSMLSGGVTAPWPEEQIFLT